MKKKDNDLIGIISLIFWQFILNNVSKMIEATDMWFYLRMLRILWKARLGKEEATQKTALGRKLHL